MTYATEVTIDSYHNSASCRSFPQYSAMNINFDQLSYHCRSANTETIETFVKHHNGDDFISRQIPPQVNSEAPTHASECLILSDDDCCKLIQQIQMSKVPKMKPAIHV